jgi:hypothetical protein
MKSIPVAIGIALLLCLPAFSMGASPMVERHIFMPEGEEQKSPEAVKEKSPEVERLEKELLFTGVIIGPTEKRAMVTEKAGRKGKDAKPEKSPLLREGDEIGGMTVKEIGRNYLVLTGQGKDVRLNLYQQNKERPAPPPEPKTAEAQPAPPQPGEAAPTQPETAEQQGAQPSAEPAKPAATAPGQAKRPSPETAPAQGGTNQGGPSEVSQAPTNPFAEALKRAGQSRQENRKSTTVNPFLDAIRRSQGDQAR